ncbi:dihydrofolate reductase family protein [Leifsonia sp. F6_8S_P_1B]|uniref:Dihydrofolate reductase family protein n=1 Tax=Leifsonia williamsii TaxID=3035919 RepID=A0ABT8K930_9MICO|nr:dihydrofolate reductase family protein [Leifsonia williamsii]MDN4613980.1 dihydrofolate reductase family protein [Leifsonia williamsii]
MGAIAVHEFISLDGVFEDPRWTAEFGFDPEMSEDIGRITRASDAILLGRTTFEMFAPAWSTRTAEDDPGAPFFNDTQKTVVGDLDDATAEATWANSRSLGAYDTERVRAFKESVGGAIYVSGSGTLVRSLLADGLIDRLHLFVYPIVLGSGAHLFPQGSPTTRLRLRQQDVYDNGVLHLVYTPA